MYMHSYQDCLDVYFFNWAFIYSILCVRNRKALKFDETVNALVHVIGKELKIPPSSGHPDKSAYLKIYFFYFSTKTYVVGTQKNRLNETVLSSTQNTCLNWWISK